MTFELFLHWQQCKFSLTFFLIFSIVIFPTFPSLLLAGFIRQHLRLICYRFMGWLSGHAFHSICYFNFFCHTFQVFFFCDILWTRVGKNKARYHEDFPGEHRLKITIETNLKMLISWMLHSIYATEDTNLISNQMKRLSMSISAQTIQLISSKHCQTAFQQD